MISSKFEIDIGVVVDAHKLNRNTSGYSLVVPEVPQTFLSNI